MSIFLCCSELLFVNEREWHKIRGAQMILAMKVISLSFDSDIGTIQNVPPPLDYAGYVFNVGTCVFGPWVSYRDYLAIFNRPVWVRISPHFRFSFRFDAFLWCAFM